MNTVISQALATGLPVITTRHSGLPEQVTDGVNGRLVDERDVTGLADSILELLADPAAVERFSRASRDQVKQRYDAGPLIERQIAHYRRLAGR